MNFYSIFSSKIVDAQSLFIRYSFAAYSLFIRYLFDFQSMFIRCQTYKINTLVIYNYELLFKIYNIISYLAREKDNLNNKLFCY